VKFLITGARGQLGQAFRRLFDDLNSECILSDVIQLDDDHHHLDITDISEVRKFLTEEPVDCIINCAAYNDVDKAETDWKTANVVNGIGPKNLATVSNEIGASIVHYSTDYVFDGTKNAPYKTDDIPNPISKYGESKLLGEKFVQEVAAKYYLIRVSWLFGRGQVNFPVKLLNWSQARNLSHPQLEPADQHLHE
jgi:dTDP-4-dehydrorhamnose reductase